MSIDTTTDRSQSPADPFDSGEIEAFAGRIVGDVASAWTVASVHLGDRLGLYAALAEGSGTAAEIAARASCHERLTEEWLRGQAAAGIVRFHHGSDGTRRYTLPPAHAAVLAVPDSPAFLAAAGGVLASVLKAEDRIVDAFHGDGALAWGDQSPCLYAAVDRFYRTGYATSLVAEWVPALTRAVDDLDAGGRVADVGCGRGTTIAMLAEAFPTASFVGVDSHPASLAKAAERVGAADAADRVQLEHADAATFGGGPYDLICFFDALHDMGDPAAAITNARRQLAPTGSVMLVEPAAEETLDGSVGNVVAQLYYPGSAFLCTPGAIAQGGEDVLGNQVPEATWRRLFTDAGFGSFRLVASTPVNRVFEARL